MIQVIQPIDGRPTEVVEVPDPVCLPRQVLIANACSLISAGTERGLVALARKSLLAKARERPDHVRRVLQKVRREGLASTIGQVRAKLDRPMPLGYSSAGVVIEVGEGVESFRPGDRVASNSPHAGSSPSARTWWPTSPTACRWTGPATPSSARSPCRASDSRGPRSARSSRWSASG